MRCGRAGFTTAAELWCRTVSGTRILRPPLVTAPGRACAAGTAATTFTRSTPASPCATTRTNAWPSWTPAIFPTAAGCTPGTRSPRRSGCWNARCAVTWPRPPPGWIGLVLRYCRPVRLLSSSRSTKTKTPAGIRRVLLFWWDTAHSIRTLLQSMHRQFPASSQLPFRFRCN